MSAPLKRVKPVQNDHEYVGRISTQTTIFVLIAIALILYEIQWILPPFVFAGLLAYVSTPAIDWSTTRSGLPRPLVALAIFIVFLLLAAAIAYLGVPPLVREMTHLFSDFEGIIRALAQRMIGNEKISLLGQPMDAEEFAHAIGNGLRDWFSQTRIERRSLRHDIWFRPDAGVALLLSIERADHRAGTAAVGATATAAADRAYLVFGRSVA